ncbi:MAG TPA: transcriptional regulator [Paludibacteraceae bacterium]|nr:transcriptional regulator [Paludibacteraceae bacterium]HPO67045.1 transcriptional regulator [Paludibacteraceae bacterium]
MKNIFIYFFFFFLMISLNFLFCPKIYAEWNSFIINYDKNLYGKGSQTWQIVPYDTRWVYFANKNGLLEFNGILWNLFPLNTGSDARSVYPSKRQQRIYVGSINELGYFEPNEKGKLNYICLSDSFDIANLQIGNIWKIYENDNILYFQGDNKIIKYLNGKFFPIEAHRKIECSDLVNGVIYIGTEEGVWVLVGNTFSPLQGAESLISKRIRGVVPYGKGILIVTAYDGLYYYDEHTLKPYLTGFENFMKQNEVFCAASSEQLIALGTIHGGILLINNQNHTVKYFNENNGLQNNTVLSLTFDKWNNLWAGLDNGIDYICLNSPFTNLYSYPYSYGTGYAALLSDNYLYLGTNRGLYYTKYPVEMVEGQPNISPVPSSSGQVWDLCNIDNNLFCCHDRGIFQIKGTNLHRIGNITGVWSCKPISGRKDRIYAGTYDGLYLLEKKDNKWKVMRKIEGFFDSCRFFEEETSNILWIFNTEKPIKITLDSSLTQVVNIKKYDTQNGLPCNRNIYISKIKGEIYFATPKGIYQYDQKIDSIYPAKEINQMLDGEKDYSRLIEFNHHLISINHKEICISEFPFKSGNKSRIIPIEFQTMDLVHGAENIIPINDSSFVIPNEYGFAFLKVPSDYKTNENSCISLTINKVYISHPKDSLIYLDNFLHKKITPKIPFSHNTIRIEYGVSSFTQRTDFNYQYRLNNEHWSDFTNSNTKEYSKLHEGTYTFEVRILLEDGKIKSDNFSFIILPPWYRSKIAYLFYFIILIFCLFGIYKWDDARIKKKKLQATLAKDEELKNMEKEFEEENKRKEQQIIQFEKEKLEHDLQYKSQEMANLMINLVRKNEILTEIKSDLFKIKSSLKFRENKEIERMLLLTNNKIDSNIKSDEILKQIEEQFDLIHNNFMKRLQEKYPDLSVNERMMCVYLKMNLSTKEIAPLLNISIRGVETLRYRLRKKFSLSRDENLIDYLNTKI